MQKSLVLLLDGTLDSALVADGSRRVSNVYNINLALKNVDRYGRPQVTLYFSGVGSQNRWKVKKGPSGRRRDAHDTFRSYYYGATAEGIEQQIADCYVNLCANYDPGDLIYLFGYSRGAIAAKVLTDIIGRFGILKPDQLDHFSELWLRFREDPDEKEAVWVRRHSHAEIPVQFLGLFDSVPGFFSRRQQDIRRYATDGRLHSCVKRCVQLLAVDERRRIFSPVIFSPRADGSLAQIWIPGGHGDVGGTNHDSIWGDVALITMLWHLRRQTNLAIDKGVVRNKLTALISDSSDDPRINNDISFPWILAGISPRRLLEKSTDHYIHPLFSHIQGTRVRYGKRVTSYDHPYHKPFSTLSVHHCHERVWRLISKDLSVGASLPSNSKPTPGPWEMMCDSRR